MPLARLCVEEHQAVTRTVDARLKLVPDIKSGVKRLAVQGKALADVKLSVELRDGALLKSLNSTSQGRAGDVIVGIAKLAGTILSGGVTAMFAQGAAPPKPTKCNPFVPPFTDLPDNMRLLLSRNESACTAWGAMAEWGNTPRSLPTTSRRRKQSWAAGPRPNWTWCSSDSRACEASDARKRQRRSRPPSPRA